MLWDDENLYVAYYCKDKHISGSVVQRHGPVSKDDCVEIFLSPNPQKVRNYYTFEINVLGTMLNRARTDWWTGPPTWEPEGVRYQASFHGQPKKEESTQDDHWIVELAIPFRNFAKDAAHTPPRDGDEWRLNLNRTGGITNKQNSSWSPIPADVKSFHTPEAFGTVRFIAQQRGPGRGRRARSRRLDPEAVAQGREIYNRSCTVCHGLNGTVGDRAPALAAARRYLRTSDQDLFDAIKLGIPGTLMPATGLSDQDARKVVEYIRSLRATAADAPVAGDTAHGEQVFRTQGRCLECHMVRGRGGFLGPDLSNIASQRSLQSLQEALTKERPNHVRGYKAARIVTADGKSLSGILRNEDGFSLQFMDSSGKLHLLSRDEVRDVSYEQHSLMPTDYDRRLSAQEMQDLLAYLSRLVRNENQ